MKQNNLVKILANAFDMNYQELHKDLVQDNEVYEIPDGICSKDIDSEDLELLDYLGLSSNGVVEFCLSANDNEQIEAKVQYDDGYLAQLDITNKFLVFLAGIDSFSHDYYM